MNKLIYIAVASVLTAMAVPASAQFAKAEDAIKYRQSALFVMGQHFGRLAAMAQGKIPHDPKAAADSAAVVENMSRLPWAAFRAAYAARRLPSFSTKCCRPGSKARCRSSRVCCRCSLSSPARNVWVKCMSKNSSSYARLHPSFIQCGSCVELSR